MLGAKCRAKRSSAPIVRKAESSAPSTGPAKFDGRENLGGPKAGSVTNKQGQGTSGKSRIATRIP